MPVDMSIEINPHLVKLATEALDPSEYDRRIEGAMDEALGYLKSLVQENTPVNNGPLRAGIFTEQRGTGVERYGIVSPSPATKEYAYVQELGRKPGSRMPPVDAILLWVQRKHIGGAGSGGRGAGRASTQRGIAFVIARSIGRKGTPAHHMFEQAYTRGQARVQAIFARRLQG